MPGYLAAGSREDANTMAGNGVEQPALQISADYEAAIEQCLAQMRHLREQMDKDQTEIDRLKVETRTILLQLKAP